jgi:hypothetical protein
MSLDFLWVSDLAIVMISGRTRLGTLYIITPWTSYYLISYSHLYSWEFLSTSRESTERFGG